MARFSIRTDDPAQSLEEIWPPFGLRVETPRLALRVLREDDFPAYVAAATSGVTHTERNPFAHAWNDKPPEELIRASLSWVWSHRAKVGPESWSLMLGVFLKPDDDGGLDRAGPGWSGRDGAGSAGAGVVRSGERLIGMQDCGAQHWTVLRTVASGSWLRADQQGHGYGREMRAGMLLWAVDHFGAAYATSGAYEWNERSRRVSLGLGYQVVGRRLVPDAHGEQAEWQEEYRLAAEDLVRPDWFVQVQGSERLREFLAG
ncbi:GNAT family N-acetyltransferase [Nesterenkonia sp. HG001]|uniref:GNAT family N-acetyltransferase n=1 Tax=Nesterenkonia sp. HG001 TaxID=2983207 RepID=UPI002AC3C1FD|nr:GNAT family N-acetyltransferase [Nesterenkonia sp. HG001]MDZ5078225.1 GNAT family N-acetyltransferase [Nesterenkonia sp. HG001]